MNIQLFALDLDGTLLNDDKVISEENKKAISKLLEKEIKVVLTTSRPLVSIENILEELKLNNKKHYSITYNGGYVQSNDGKVLFSTYLDLRNLETVYAGVKRLGLPFDMVSGNDVYQIGGRSIYPKLNPTLTFHKTNITKLDKKLKYNKVMIVSKDRKFDEKIEELRTSFGHLYEFIKSQKTVLEILPKNLSKAVGIQQLAQHLKIPVKNIMSVGDHENDLEMIKFSGVGIAMSNAIPEVKKVANIVSPWSNNESAISKIITTYIFGIQYYKQKYKGKRVFVVGNGPSLRLEDLEKIKENGDYTIAFNRIYLSFPDTTWRPDFYMISDAMLINEHIEDLEQLELEKKFVFNQNNRPELIKRMLESGFMELTANYNVRYPYIPGFYNDDFFQESEPLFYLNSSTVSFVALQLAYYLGFSEVYLLGVDFSYANTLGIDGKVENHEGQKDYFKEVYKEENRFRFLPNLYLSEKAYSAAALFAMKNKDFDIYNATRGGKLEIFPRVEFDEIYGGEK